jgi:hypothetical protein
MKHKTARYAPEDAVERFPFSSFPGALTQDGLLKLRHLLPQVIDVSTEFFDLSGQQVKRPGWLFVQWHSGSVFAITGRVSTGVRRTMLSHARKAASFGACRPPISLVAYGG